MKTRVIDRPWMKDSYRYLVQVRGLFGWSDVDSYPDLKRAIERAAHMANPPLMWTSGDSIPSDPTTAKPGVDGG